MPCSPYQREESMANQQKPAPSSRNVRDVMTANPVCVSEKDSVQDAARIMAREDTGVVPVVDGKKIIGLITDRDIVVRLIAEGKDLANARVNEAMTKNVRTVREDASVNDVLEVMNRSEVRRVPVVNDRDELVGIVSIGDVAEKTNQDGKVGKTVENISQAPPNN
jgi:CBS domain-containing protein